MSQQKKNSISVNKKLKNKNKSLSNKCVIIHDPKIELIPRNDLGTSFYLQAFLDPKFKDGITIPTGYSTLIDCGLEVTTTGKTTGITLPAEFIVAGGGICQPLIFNGKRQIMLRIFATIKPIVITHKMNLGELHLFNVDKNNVKFVKKEIEEVRKD